MEKVNTQTNLKQIKTLPHRQYKVSERPLTAIGIVVKGMQKFLTTPQIRKVLRFRRSEITAKALKTDFLRGNIEKKEIVKDKTYYQALKIVTTMFKPPKRYRPVHFCDLRYYPWTLNTSVEEPFSEDKSLQKRIQTAHAQGKLDDARMSKHNCKNHAFVYNRNIVHQIKEGKARGGQYLYNIKAHARSHLVDQDEEDKVRMVFGVPWLTLMVECMFLWPYIRYLKEGKSPIAWGYETLDGGFQRINLEAGHLDGKFTIIGLDWKGFDKNASFSIIADVHNEWKSFIIFDKGYLPTKEYLKSETNPRRLATLFDWMTKSIKYAPVLLPDGTRYVRRFAGIPSGVLQTQILDTWVNAIMIITCLLDMGFEITPETYQKYLGDDSFLFLDRLIKEVDHEGFLNKFAEVALKRFGAILNRKKSMISNKMKDMEFLGYRIGQGIPLRDEYRLLAQLTFPERHWDINKLMARCVGIAYASAGQSKLVLNVCNDVFNFCKSIGGSPDVRGFHGLDWRIPSGFIDITKFPNSIELTQRLIELRDSRTLKEKDWPSTWFLEEY
jgi:hypothetical protein